jgi:hypothetical protein
MQRVIAISGPPIVDGIKGRDAPECNMLRRRTDMDANPWYSLARALRQRWHPKSVRRRF